MRRFMSRAQRGELEITFSNVDEAATRLYTLGHQLIYTAVGIAAAAMAVVFDGRGQREHAKWAWWVAGGAGVFLLGSMWASRKSRRRRR
jgi:low temperature requirement protein LtrA